jgi:hypothetical protein
MAIESTEIKYRLSGGAANASAAASLGGVVSSTEVLVLAGILPVRTKVYSVC